MPLLSLTELAALLKVSPSTVRYWLTQKKIPYTKFGRHLRFDRDEVLAHFKKNNMPDTRSDSK